MSLLEVALVPRKVIKHGLIDGKRRADLPEYRIYTGMIARCKNPNVKSYNIYGGRGIRVCDRWLEDFKHFYDDMGPRPSKSHSIDRIDPNGHYEPQNCRWATPLEQAKNRRAPSSYSKDSDYYWKPEEEAVLRRMWEQHFTTEEIGRAIGRTNGTVRIRAFHLGLRRDASITKLTKKHPHLREVLKEGGVDAFLTALSREEAQRKQSAASERASSTESRQRAIAEIMARDIERNDKMRALRLVGLDLSEIASLFGVTRERVRQLQLKGSAAPGAGRKVYVSKNRVEHVDRLIRAWNRASKEARVAFLEQASDISADIPTVMPKRAIADAEKLVGPRPKALTHN